MFSNIAVKEKPLKTLGVRRLLIANFIIILILSCYLVSYLWYTLENLKEKTESTVLVRTPYRIALQKSDFLIQDISAILLSFDKDGGNTDTQHMTSMLLLKKKEIIETLISFSILDNISHTKEIKKKFNDILLLIENIIINLGNFNEIDLKKINAQERLIELHSQYLETLAAVERNVRAKLHISLAADIALEKNSNKLQELVDEFIEYKLGWLGTTHDLREDVNNLLDKTLSYSRLSQKNTAKYSQDIKLLSKKLQLYRRLPLSSWIEKLANLTNELEHITVSSPGLVYILDKRHASFEQLRSKIDTSISLTKALSKHVKKISINEEKLFSETVYLQINTITRTKKIILVSSAFFIILLIFFFYIQFFRRLVTRIESLSDSVDRTTIAISSGSQKHISQIITDFSNQNAGVSAGALAEVSSLINSLNILLTTIQIQYNEIEKARNAAEISNQAKSLFLANMSHEIRTPINGVTGFVSLLKQTVSGQKQTGYIDRIETSCRQLLLIVNDILDFSKLEKRKLALSLEPFRLYDIVEDVLLLAFEQANNKEIEFRLRIDPFAPGEMKGDVLRIGQVLKNLVVNAIKFTQKGFIDIDISLLKTAEQKQAENNNRFNLLFTVTDTGIGIKPDKKEKLFDKFYQVDDSYTRKTGGSGLGLAICKELVMLMGGEIIVESEYKKGSRFSFFVNIERSKTYETRIESSHPASGRFLLVTTSADLADQTCYLMAAYNMEGVCIDSYSSLIDEITASKTNDSPVDLIIFDIKVSDNDLLKLSLDLKTRPKTNPGIICLHPPYQLKNSNFRNTNNRHVLHLAKPLLPFTLQQSGLDLFTKDKNLRDNGNNMPGVIIFKGLENLRVLLVEDNDMNRQYITELLENAGIILDIAVDGKDAVDMLTNNGSKQYDIILMDIQMPRMDGYEATRIIRTTLGLQTLPVLAMTAHAIAEEKQKSLDAGMDDHITKPVDMNILFNTIAGFTGREITIEKKEPGEDEHIIIDEISGNINVKKALLRIGGNVSMYRDLFTRSRKVIPQQWQQFTKAFNIKDYSQAKQIIHQLKSGAGMIGLESLQNLAEKIESSLKNKQDVKPGWIVDTNDIVTWFAESDPGKYLPGLPVEHNKTSPGETAIETDLCRGLEKLRVIVNFLNRNAAVTNKELDNIFNILGEPSFKPLFEILKEHIFSLQYKKALDVTRELIALTEKRLEKE